MVVEAQPHFASTRSTHGIRTIAGCALFPSGAAAITQSILAFIEQVICLVTGSAYDPNYKTFVIRSYVNSQSQRLI